MTNVVQLELLQFSLIYLLLFIILAIMKISKIDKTKLLLLASVKMTLQLMITGYILQYIFSSDNFWWIFLFLIATASFAVHRVISTNDFLNKKFKIIIGCCLSGFALLILLFFVSIVVGESVFNPRYMIPISGMLFGNAMTGLGLALRSFSQEIKAQKSKLYTLLNLGVEPSVILRPLVNNALDTALLPTLNSMLGMGIVSLPGMMTGQILSGTSPTIAILYQIAIMIAICTTVCLVVFSSLNLGYKTLYNEKKQFVFWE